MANRAAQLRQENAGKAVTRRGRRFVEFDLGGGRRRFVTTIEPLHIGATEQEIDTAWVADAAPWQYKIAAADYTTRIKAVFNGAPLVQFTDSAGAGNVTLQPQQLNYSNDRGDVQMISAVQGVTATITDDLARWVGAYGTGRDFEYQNHPRRIIKRLLLQSAAALPTPSTQIMGGANPVLQLQFVFAWLAGLTVHINGAEWDGRTVTNTTDRIEFWAGGAVVSWLDAPVVTDANGVLAAGVVMRVRKSGPNLYVEVRTPYSWLQSATYPVCVDPTFTDGYGGDVDTAYDTYTSQYYPDNEYSTATAMYSHRYATSYQNPLLKFTLSSIPTGATINSATLTAYFSGGNGYTGYLHRILPANSGWLETCTWNHADGAGASDHWAGDVGNNGGSDAGCMVSGTDFSSTPLKTFNWFGTLNLTLDLTEFNLMLANNHGIMGWVDKANTGIPYIASSDHPTTSLRPKLVVDYTAASGGARSQVVIC